MAGELREENIEELRETWEEMDRPSYSAVGEECDVHRDTVKKYIDPWLADDEELPEDVGSIPSVEGSDDDEEPTLFPEPGDEKASAFRQFFEKLNEEYGFGIKEKAIQMMAGEVKTTGHLPGPDDVVGFLESADSGIKNTRELSWIGRQYGLWADQYQAKQQDVGGMNMMGGAQQPMFNQGGGMGQSGQYGQGQQSQPPQGGMGGGNNQMMMMMFQQMQEQMKELQKQMQQGGGDDDDDILKRKTEQFLETKLEQLIEADSTQEQEAVIAELRQLRQEMHADDSPQGVGGGDDIQSMVMALAQSGELDIEDAKDLLQTFGDVETDPRILEKKYEKEIKEQELEHQSERYEKIGGVLERMSERFGQTFAEQIASGGDEATPSSESTSQDSPEAAQAPDGGGGQPTQPSAPDTEGPVHTPMADDKECPECGTEMTVGANQAHCPECEFGIAPCDLCHYPVEIPPAGAADYARCAECETVLEVPEDPDAEVTCDECEWSGEGADLRGELLECGNCNEYRPIVRQSEMAAQQEALQNLTGD